MGDLLIIMQKLQKTSDLLSDSVTLVKDIIDQLSEKYEFSSGVDVASIEHYARLMYNDAASCSASVRELSFTIKASVPWLPESGNSDEVLRYLDGTSPWSFWLIQEKNDAFDQLQIGLQKSLAEGSLNKYTRVPTVGSYVICVDKKIVFRALVLDSLVDRLKVINIDSGSSKVVRLGNVYYLTKELSLPHAQTVHCSLTEDRSLENEWNNDLKDLFKSVMRECFIRLKVAEEIPGSFPKKFKVEMEGYNSEMDSMVDFNDWICERLLPEVGTLSHNFLNASLDKLGEHVLDPWGSVENGIGGTISNSGQGWSATLLEQPTASSVLMASCDTDLVASLKASNIDSIPDPPTSTTAPPISKPSLSQLSKSITSTKWSVDKIVEFKPSSKSPVLNVHSPSFQPKNLEINGNNENVTVGASLNQSKPFMNHLVCENFSSKGFCLSFNCSKLHNFTPAHQ